jgi:hypothetical protein
MPERSGSVTFQAQKCIVVVRNPLDCMVSLWHMIATGSHNNSMSEDDFTKHYDKFEEFIK